MTYLLELDCLAIDLSPPTGCYHSSTMHPKRLNSGLPAEPSTTRWLSNSPVIAILLALVQLIGVVISALPSLQALVAVSPDAIFRRGQLWRLGLGPFIESEFSWPVAVFNVACVFVFAWHLEITQGRRRTMLLFFGGSIFAATLWSIAALVWNWHRPLFSPVAATALGVAALTPGLRRPFPAFLPYRVPVWIVFVGYAALWETLTFSGAIDLSAHFLAGLFAILVAQSSPSDWSRRTEPRAGFVTTPPERDDRPPGPSLQGGISDPDFDRRVDDLLRKITETGYDSLAEDEIALLLEASQRYRDRSAPPSP